jgi:hypothetical protein
LSADKRKGHARGSVALARSILLASERSTSFAFAAIRVGS